MSSTKIINVSRDDRFDEVLEAFRRASAEEVIFVLPKNAKAFNREANLATLRDLSEEQGKKVSLLCPNPRVVALGNAYGFSILPDRVSEPAQKKAKAKLVKADPLDDDTLDRVRDDADAFEENVAVPSDEALKLNEDDENLASAHEEDERGEDLGEVSDQDADELQEKGPTDEEMDTLEEDGTLSAARLVSAQQKNKSAARPEDIAQVWQSKPRGATMWSDIPHQAAPTHVFRGPGRGLRLRVLGTMVGIVGLGALVYFTTGSAHITVTPVSQDLETTIHASISDAFSQVDTAFSRLPGQVFTIEKTVTQEFLSSGEKDVAQKAKGVITVSNALSTSQQLIATTRFQSPGGLIFRSLRSITVPAATTVSGKSVPGTQNVEVIADKSGGEYNIEPGSFTIPAFKERNDTERYTKVTATSAKAFTGGITGKAKVVTEADSQNARDTVMVQAKTDTLAALKAEIGNLIAPEPSVIVKDVTLSMQVDQAADSFSASGTGAVKTIGIEQEDLAKLIIDVIGREQHLVVLPNQLEITLESGQFSETTGAYETDIKVRGKGYAQIEEEKIIADLMGKSEADIRSYLKSAFGVATARVILSPFWVTKMPKSKEKVRFQLIYP
ncbi:MAG: hypothetical protein AAB864_00540 [Patescibacteria group bacterium]